MFDNGFNQWVAIVQLTGQYNIKKTQMEGLFDHIG